MINYLQRRIYCTGNELELELENMKREKANQQCPIQSRIINDFWNRGRREYLTSLREHHKNTGVKVCDVVKNHDDTPRTI